MSELWEGAIVKQDQVKTLIRAHFDRDEHRFCLTVKQIAAQLKDRDLADLMVKQATRLVELPSQSRGLLTQAPAVAVGDLLLPEGVGALLAELAREYRHASALSARGLAPRSRLLFCGPPGNGKTSAASALAGMLGMTPYVAILSAIVNSFLGDTSKKVTDLFAALDAGNMLVLDEIDALGGERHGGDAANKERALTVNVLLTEMDRCRSGVLVATTNRKDLLDAALLRRFEEVIEFPAPTSEQLGELSRRLSAKYGLSEPVALDYEVNNFDAATKAVRREARRVALEQIESEADRNAAE